MGAPRRRASIEPTRRASRRHAGVSLVELMVGMTVSLIVVGALASSFIGVLQGSRSLAGMADIADSGEVTMMLIGDAIRQAGYGELVGSEVALGPGDVEVYRSQTLLADEVHLAGCSGARMVDDTAAAPVCGPPTNTNFDTLRVGFQSDTVLTAAQGPVTDCLGLAVPQAALPLDHIGRGRTPERPIVRNTFYGWDGAIWCRGNGRTVPGVPVTADPQQLASDVEQFKVFYGFDDARYGNAPGDPVASARSLRDAAFLNGLPPETRPWDFVVTVHVCMVIRSDPDRTASARSTAGGTFRRCPSNAAEAGALLPEMASPDRLVRRTFTKVFTVRARSNANPLQGMP
jgi:hypothetical protein